MEDQICLGIRGTSILPQACNALNHCSSGTAVVAEIRNRVSQRDAEFHKRSWKLTKNDPVSISSVIQEPEMTGRLVCTQHPPHTAPPSWLLTASCTRSPHQQAQMLQDHLPRITEVVTDGQNEPRYFTTPKCQGSGTRKHGTTEAQLRHPTNM
jgi:hypothetical protein